MVLTLYTSKQFSFQPVMSNADNVKKLFNNDYIFELFGNMLHILVSGRQLEYSIFQSGLNFVNLKCQLVETSTLITLSRIPILRPNRQY